jgi:hypothetical protein
MKNCRIPEQPNYDINLTNIYSRFWINIGLIFFPIKNKKVDLKQLFSKILNELHLSISKRDFLLILLVSTKEIKI